MKTFFKIKRDKPDAVQTVELEFKEYADGSGIGVYYGEVMLGQFRKNNDDCILFVSSTSAVESHNAIALAKIK